MMTNLFSSFDPSTEPLFSMNWISTILGFTLIPFSMWLIPSRMNIMWMKIHSTLNKEFSILLKTQNKSNTLLFISLFMMILFSNSLSLFPYVFSTTSHLAMTLALSLPLWISFMIYGWMNHTIHMFAHLIPEGTPPILMPFMVCIETISNIIRPGTLAVRLSANMIAGHLLLTLLGSTGTKLSMMMINILIIAQLALLILESAVAIIQSYVFSVLSALYSSEVNYDK
uniref:ATP synthase F0 subunit 6 n=1 Tax=Photinus signaticollis TaxID=3018954 RepID=UPI0023AB5634|nr:ATP synthase F0 subunit 6 [Photinus signaticollis]WCD24459.1 ATP synthase F0 subunit 6 [Photinus signaticollis]